MEKMADQHDSENVESTIEKKMDTVNLNSDTLNVDGDDETSKNEVKNEENKKLDNETLLNYMAYLRVKSNILRDLETWIDNYHIDNSSPEGEKKPEIIRTDKKGFTRLAGIFEYDKNIQHQLYLEDFKVVGLFGRDVEGQYKNDESILKYLHIPPSPEVNFDLTLKHEKDEKRNSGLTLDHWYKWIMDTSKDEAGNPIRPQQRFIILRCMLQTLMMSPYAKEDGWDLHAVQLKGSIYLELLETSTTAEAVNNFFEAQKTEADENKKVQDAEQKVEEEKKTEEKECVDERDKNEALCNAMLDAISNAHNEATQYDNWEMYERYGGKFEQYLSSKSRDVAPDPTEPLRKYDDFCLAMRAYIGRHSLLYAGEMDAFPKDVDNVKDVTSPVFVELKTMKEKYNPFSHKRYRLLKWWAQCTLAMCRWVLVGYRDDTTGMVRKLERVDVFQIPKLVDRIWDARQCYTYLNKLLDFIDKTVSKYPQGMHFKFMYRPKKKMDTVFAFVYAPKWDLCILPEFYEEWLKQFADTKMRFLDKHQQNNEGQ